MIEDQIVNAIRTAADGKIPPLHRGHEDKPWADEEFLTVLEKRRKSFDTTEIKEQSAQICKLRCKLKSEFCKDKANKINLASEQRDTEEEFRQAKNYCTLSKSRQQTMKTEK